MEIKWTAPSSNFESITSYKVTIKTASGTFLEETAYCDASKATIMSVLSCKVPLATLTATPFLLTAGTPVVARVRAANARGWGTDSADNTGGAPVTTPPQQMAPPTRDSAITSTTQIKVDWLALGAPQNGMTSILSYHLQWDAGSNGAVQNELVGESTDYLGTTYTVSSGVSPGARYQFRVRARNNLGWGAFSTWAAVDAANRPGKMAAVTSELDPATGGIKFSWVAPDDGKSAITAYTLEIAYGSGPSWSTETVSCDASSSTVMTAKSCVVPMATLRAAPFSMVYGTVVQARARAYNAYGWGDWSDPAGTITVRTPPLQVSAPVRAVGTPPSVLKLTWTPLTTAAERGGAAITSYAVEWDAGTGSWTYLQGYTTADLSTSVTIITGVTPGGTYQVRVSASNTYGFGPASPATAITAAQEPAQVTQPSMASTASGLNVLLSWTAPNSN